MSYFLQPPICLTLDPSLSTSFSPFTHVSVEKPFFKLSALHFLSSLCFPRSTKLYLTYSQIVSLAPWHFG